MFEVKHIDRNANPPTLVGNGGLAWKLDLERIRTERFPGQEDAMVGGWVIFAPWANIAWSYYLLACIHLRPMPSKGHPKLYIMGASHEIVLAALDPGHVVDLLDPHRTHLLPLNYASQIALQERNPVDADKKACELIDKAVEDILAMQLNPDTDAVRQWKERFGDCMFKE